VSNSVYVMSRGGDPGLGACDPAHGSFSCEWWAREVGQQLDYGYPWSADEGSSATGFDGLAVSRDGTKFASIEDDAADWLGAAHNVELKLWSASGVPDAANETVPAPALKCQIDLPADPDSTLWFDDAGPTFSPDGTRLAFAEPDGVHVADVSNLDDCGSITAPLVLPGATQPFWSPAEEAANAGHPEPTKETVPPPPSQKALPPRPTPPAPTGRCTVPNLLGKTLKASKKKLRKAGCKLGQVRKLAGATARTGRVKRQSPKPGKLRAPGTKVSVSLAR
jgi:hypothetical protein